ncbi:MAG: hypothetical protein R3D55_16335 [Chloroflexota bacterium]
MSWLVGGCPTPGQQIPAWGRPLAAARQQGRGEIVVEGGNGEAGTAVFFHRFLLRRGPHNLQTIRQQADLQLRAGHGLCGVRGLALPRLAG